MTQEELKAGMQAGTLTPEQEVEFWVAAGMDRTLAMQNVFVDWAERNREADIAERTE